MRLWFSVASLVAVAVLSGCGSARIPSEPAESLAEVNRQLDDRWARIWTTDGELIDHVESVRIRRDSTSYTNSSTGRSLSLPTEDVETVAIRGDSGGAIGFALGAVPGTLLVFSGGSGGNGIGAFLGVVLGIPAAILGGALGSLLFDALIADEWHPIYEGPAYNNF